MNNFKSKRIKIDEFSNYFNSYISVLRRIRINTLYDLLLFNKIDEKDKCKVLQKYTNNYEELITLMNNITDFMIKKDNTFKSYKKFHNILLTETNFNGILNEKTLKTLYSKGIYRLETLFTESDKDEFITIGDINTKKDIIYSCKLLRAQYLNEFPFTNLNDPKYIYNFFSNEAIYLLKTIINKEDITFDDIMNVIKSSELNKISNIDKKVLIELKTKLSIIYNSFFDLSNKDIISYDKDTDNKVIKNMEFMESLSKDKTPSSYMVLLNRIEKLNLPDDEKKSLYDEIAQIQELHIKDKKDIVRLNIMIKKESNY